MSWVSDLASKGGSLLNTLDDRVANLLNTPNSQSPHYSVQNDRNHVRISFNETPVNKSQTIPMVTEFKPSTVFKKNETASVNRNTDDDDAELFALLNNPSSVEQLFPPKPLETVTSLPNSIVPQSQSGSNSLISSTTVDTEIHVSNALNSKNAVDTNDVLLENKLLRREISSLNQEFVDLRQRNQKSNNEIQQLKNQISDLTTRLHDKEQDWSIKAPNENGELIDKVNLLSQSLLQAQTLLSESESKAVESRKLSEIANGRADQLQKEVTRLSRYLAEYKEKAVNILSSKEKVIEVLKADAVSSDGSLKNNASSSSSDSELLTLQSELQLVQQEQEEWRFELDRREVAFQQLEEMMRLEHASLRKTIEVLEQQLAREKLSREEAEKELPVLLAKLSAQEEQFAREKSELHSVVQSNETELARMRHRISNSERQVAYSVNDQHSLSVADRERILALEANIRQLNDSLITKQDSLDATLSQNHTLKMRLNFHELENEVRLLDTAKHGFANSQPSQSSVFGFTRLHFLNSNLPFFLRTSISMLDNFVISLVTFLRRRPLFRLLFTFYLIFIHFWFILAFFVFSTTSSDSTRHAKQTHSRVRV